MKFSVFVGGAALLLLAGCQGGMSMGIPGWSQQKVPVANTTMNGSSGSNGGAGMSNNGGISGTSGATGSGTTQ